MVQNFFHQPYDYWYIYYIKLSCRILFHEQYPKNLDTSQGWRITPNEVCSVQDRIGTLKILFYLGRFLDSFPGWWLFPTHLKNMRSRQIGSFPKGSG